MPGWSTRCCLTSRAADARGGRAACAEAPSSAPPLSGACLPTRHRRFRVCTCSGRGGTSFRQAPRVREPRPFPWGNPGAAETPLRLRHVPGTPARVSSRDPLPRHRVGGRRPPTPRLAAVVPGSAAATLSRRTAQHAPVPKCGRPGQAHRGSQPGVCEKANPASGLDRCTRATRDDKRRVAPGRRTRGFLRESGGGLLAGPSQGRTGHGRPPPPAARSGCPEHPRGAAHVLLGAGPREALVSRSGQPGRGPGSGDFTPQGACLRSSGRRPVQTRLSQAAGCSVVMGTRLLRPALSLGSHLTQKQPPQGGTLWGHRVPRRPPAGLLGDPRLQGAGAPRQLRSSPLFLRPLPHTRGSAYLLLTGGQVTSPAAASMCGSMTCGPQTLANGGGGGRRSSQKPAGRSAGPGACSRLTCWAAGPAEPAPSARPDAPPLSPGSGRSSGLQLVHPSVFGLPVTVQPPPAQTASTSVPWGTRSLHNGPRTPGDRRPSGSACGGGTQEGSQ